VSYVQRHKISETYLPPPAIIAISQCTAALPKNLKSVRQIWYGGAGYKAQNQAKMLELLHPEAKIQPVWGMTETGWITCSTWTGKTPTDSVAKPLKRFRIRVVDDNQNVLADGSIGELIVKSPAPMLGYLDNKEATVEAFTPDGLVRTGDVGYMTNDNVFVIDRKKDMTKVRGRSVSPAEIESVLMEHDRI
jgi:acyl-CoA synthetase (AMP-forming)/AMP-acid ligase II